jgi:hypothetical protein
MVKRLKLSDKTAEMSDEGVKEEIERRDKVSWLCEEAEVGEMGAESMRDCVENGATKRRQKKRRRRRRRRRKRSVVRRRWSAWASRK